jgi:NTE family protein
MTYRKQIFLLLILVFYVSSLFSQPVKKEPAKKSPTVGLVLSGGGAKGFAYIGFMKVLYEVNMPIDYIGGSSMGAITAALFSLGYSPDTIANLVRGYDWDKLINDVQDRRYMAYEEKLFSERSFFTVPIEDKFFALNKSLSTSFNIDLMLNKLLASGAHVTDFNDLPIPFLCIGTDLLTGEAVVLNKGDLARAVRASMSIPGFFPPVHYDGRYLVDGGVVNNYPAEQIKALGADIIIGGDVQSGLIKSIEEIGSMASIIDQVIALTVLMQTKKGTSLPIILLK